MAFTVGSITVAPSGSATRQTLVAATTITATTTGTGTLIGLDAFSIADLFLNVTAASWHHSHPRCLRPETHAGWRDVG
jgi:hypothetical protein